MFYTHKAYLNAQADPSVLILTHDVKRCLVDSKAKSGHIQITSSHGTTGVMLIENDPGLQKEYIDYIQKTFEEAPSTPVKRRSSTGPNKHHHMAALCGLTLTIPFENGRLLSSPFHEIIALDFEPKPGRREFVMTVVGE